MRQYESSIIQTSEAPFNTASESKPRTSSSVFVSASYKLSRIIAWLLIQTLFNNVKD